MARYTIPEASVIGRCQHCNVKQFDNPQADPALDSMAHLCWKCVRSWNAETHPKGDSACA